MTELAEKARHARFEACNQVFWGSQTAMAQAGLAFVPNQRKDRVYISSMHDRFQHVLRTHRLLAVRAREGGRMLESATIRRCITDLSVIRPDSQHRFDSVAVSRGLQVCQRRLRDCRPERSGKALGSLGGVQDSPWEAHSNNPENMEAFSP